MMSKAEAIRLSEREADEDTAELEAFFLYEEDDNFCEEAESVVFAVESDYDEEYEALMRDY
ncbi:MAG: hypothetical protein WDZ64_01115 [Parcubacteria group bacterium]